MRRLLSCLAAILCAAGSAPHQTRARNAVPIPVHVGGRVARLPDGGDLFGWPGVYFEGRFRGDAVTVAVDAGDQNLEVLIDGRSRDVLRHPGQARRTYAGLGAGAHQVRLQALTENQGGSAAFVGFFPGPGGRSLPPRTPSARQIEIVGDSYSVGYGDASAKRTCTQDEIHDTTNTQLAYGPLAARQLGADYRVNAFSGIGVVRNYDGRDPERSLPSIYDRLIPGDPSRLQSADPAWRPQLIVVALGTNDFSTAVHAGERWKDGQALAADYIASYGRFLRRLHARQPQARFILLAHRDWAGQVQAVARAFNAEGQARVLTYADLQLTGCDWHPSLADQKRLAEDLVRATDGFIAFPPRAQ